MLEIRPIEPKDAKDFHEIRIMNGVMDTTLGLASNKLQNVEKMCSDTDPDNHVFVAVMDGKVVGVAGLHINKNPRTRHVGGLGISVHKAYHGKGIGSKLMTTLLELADNWLMLVRVELTVFSDNSGAIELYKKFGFFVEGEQKYSAIKNGQYAHQLMMARYNTGRKEEDNE